MPVVINEFEVVPDPAPPPQTDGARPDANDNATTRIAEAQFEEFLRRRCERAQRLRAH